MVPAVPVGRENAQTPAMRKHEAPKQTNRRRVADADQTAQARGETTPEELRARRRVQADRMSQARATKTLQWRPPVTARRNTVSVN